MGTKERNTLKVAALKAGEPVAAMKGRPQVKYLPEMGRQSVTHEAMPRGVPGGQGAGWAAPEMHDRGAAEQQQEERLSEDRETRLPFGLDAQSLDGSGTAAHISNTNKPSRSFKSK